MTSRRIAPLPRRRTCAAPAPLVAEPVHAAHDVLRRAFGQRRLRVVLVHHRDVVELVGLPLEHPPHAVIEDDGELARERGIVGAAIGHCGGHHVTAAVLVLETFAAERRAPCRGAEQEAARTLVRRGPDEIADALEPEHRVVDVEGQHRLSVCAVRRRGRRPRCERARFGDAFLEELPVRRFAVVEHRPCVLGLVLLAGGRIDADLAEEIRHAERARFVRDDRHDARTQDGVLEQRAHETHGRHRRRHFLALRRDRELRVAFERRHGNRRCAATARGQGAAQRGTARAQVAHLRAVVAGPIEGKRRDLGVPDRQRKAVAEAQQGVDVELLLLVHGHARLAGLAHAEALLGLGEDDGGPATMQASPRERRSTACANRVRRGAARRSPLRSSPRRSRVAPARGRRSARGCSGRPWRPASGTRRRGSRQTRAAGCASRRARTACPSRFPRAP